MFEHNILTDDLLAVIATSEIIEEYPDDDPCPSALFLGFINYTKDSAQAITVSSPCIFRKMSNGKITARGKLNDS
jgi:hypothetical protein